MVHVFFTHNSISSKTFSVIYRREEAMSYGQGNRYAELMGLRGASSENAPEPAAAKMWRDESIRSGHGMGYSVERLNNEWARPPLAHGQRSFESAMNYLFSEAPPIADEMGEFEGRPH